MKELLELRKKMNAKRPVFAISNKHKRIRVMRCSWRKPRGHHNKEKLGKHGKKAVVNIGYRSPRLVRNLSNDGLEKVKVYCLNDLKNIDPQKQCVLISSVGMKKKQSLLEECKKQSLKVFNHDVDKSLSAIRESFAERKKAKDSLKKAKESEEKKKKVEKAKETEVESQEDKKEKEEKQKEKVLTRRE